MEQFLLNNWLSILSIIIGILVAYVFYRLQKKDSTSASSERKKHAANELLDVVESYIINKQRLSETVIENLIHASERDHTVELRPTCPPITLLQDVALRLQRSRHLDIPQKSEYSENIEHLIITIKQSHSELQPTLNENDFIESLNKLQLLLPSEKQDEGLILIEKITSTVNEQQNIKIEKSKSDQSRKALTMATTLIGVLSSLATALIGSKVYEDVSTSMFAPVFAKLLPMMGLLIVAVISIEALSTLFRIKRRNHLLNKNNDS